MPAFYSSGNGPSGICLSYMLSGNWPYYNGDHIPDPLLSDRVEYCGTEVSLVEQVHTILLNQFPLTIFNIPNWEDIKSNFSTLQNKTFSILLIHSIFHFFYPIHFFFVFVHCCFSLKYASCFMNCLYFTQQIWLYR